MENRAKRIKSGTPCVECGDPSITKGLCREHYNETRRLVGAKTFKPRKNPDGTPCKCEWPAGCDKDVYSSGFCKSHYAAHNKGGAAGIKRCPVPRCERDIFIRTIACKKHAGFAHRYSLSIDEVVALHQDYRCSNRFCEAVSDLHMDHDHACCPDGAFPGSRIASCGKCNRGWLCRNCNWSLGHSGDSPERLQGLIDYLARARKRQ